MSLSTVVRTTELLLGISSMSSLLPSISVWKSNMQPERTISSNYYADSNEAVFKSLQN